MTWKWNFTWSSEQPKQLISLSSLGLLSPTEIQSSYIQRILCQQWWLWLLRLPHVGGHQISMSSPDQHVLTRSLQAAQLILFSPASTNQLEVLNWPSAERTSNTPYYKIVVSLEQLAWNSPHERSGEVPMLAWPSPGTWISSNRLKPRFSYLIVRPVIWQGEVL